MFEQYNADATAVGAFDQDELQAKVNSGANWFFWIAGLSLVNSMVMFFEGNWSFAIGLGVTQIFDAFANVAVQNGVAGWVKLAALTADILVICIFIGFGFLGRARYVWAFIVGMVLFALDSVIFILAVDILGIIIHAVALFFLFGGMMAARKLNADAAGAPMLSQ